MKYIFILASLLACFQINSMAEQQVLEFFKSGLGMELIAIGVNQVVEKRLTLQKSISSFVNDQHNAQTKEDRQKLAKQEEELRNLHTTVLLHELQLAKLVASFEGSLTFNIFEPEEVKGPQSKKKRKNGKKKKKKKSLVKVTQKNKRKGKKKKKYQKAK